MSDQDIDRVASEITHELAQILNKRFDIVYLSEEEEERLLIHVIHTLEQLMVDKATSSLCRWAILFILNFGVIALGKSCNVI